MTHNHFTTFAVAGAGNIGNPIARALLAHEVKVMVLSRPDSQTSIDGIEVRKVDHAGQDATAEALKDVDVVISTISAMALPFEASLTAAAKKAGMKLFAPS